MSQKNSNSNNDKEIIADPFFSTQNIAELERRANEIKCDASVLKEHELIEVDDE